MPFLQQAKAIASAHPIQALGPIPAGMAKRANRYHMQLLLLANTRRELHQIGGIGGQIVVVSAPKASAVSHRDSFTLVPNSVVATIRATAIL